jgi:hypothetical protein
MRDLRCTSASQGAILWDHHDIIEWHKGASIMARQGFKIVGALMLACMGSSAISEPRGDFGAINICTELKTMPKGYVPHECDRKAPLRKCYFALQGDSWPITYLVENRRILDKYMEFKGAANLSGPFGLRKGDSEQQASTKFRQSTGLSLTSWSDHEDREVTYLQTVEQACVRNTYTISLWFRNGSLTAVGVSSLPVT